eukprot:4618045-Alexandrium_andersonii.AAC.1
MSEPPSDAAQQWWSFATRFAALPPVQEWTPPSFEAFRRQCQHAKGAPGLDGWYADEISALA